MGLFDKFKKKELETRPYDLSSCVNGIVIPLIDVKDEAFKSGALGKGAGIQPSSNSICSPIAGEVKMLFPTLHAVGLMTTEGIEILIHIGIETVELAGKGFTSFVKQGDLVSRGDKLIEADFAYIEEQGLDSTVLMVITNSANFANIDCEVGNKTIDDIIIHIEKGVA